MKLLNENDPDITYSDNARSTVSFHNNCIHSHKTIRINYTTYDGLRAQDCASPRRSSDIMVLSREDVDEGNASRSPYWYARVIGIFHANIQHMGSLSNTDQLQRFDFLWVRWFGTDPDFQTGWKVCHSYCRNLKTFLIIFGRNGAYLVLDLYHLINQIHSGLLIQKISSEPFISFPLLLMALPMCYIHSQQILLSDEL